MGFSVSASTAIIFVGLFLAFGTLYPAMSNGYERVLDAEMEHEDSQRDLRNTGIEIDSDNTNINQITVNNTGSTALTVSEVDVVVDGEYQERVDINTQVVGASGTDLWLPGEQLEITSFTGSDGEPVKIVTDHGISASGEI